MAHNRWILDFKNRYKGYLGASGEFEYALDLEWYYGISVNPLKSDDCIVFMQDIILILRRYKLKYLEQRVMISAT